MIISAAPLQKIELDFEEHHLCSSYYRSYVREDTDCNGVCDCVYVIAYVTGGCVCDST